MLAAAPFPAALPQVGSGGVNNTSLMVPTSRLECPAWSRCENVWRCLETARCSFSVPGQRVRGSALAAEQFSRCGDRRGGCPHSADLPAAQPGWELRSAEPDCYSSIPLNIDGVAGEAVGRHCRAQGKHKSVVPTTSSCMGSPREWGLKRCGGAELHRPH